MTTLTVTTTAGKGAGPTLELHQGGEGGVWITVRGPVDKVGSFIEETDARALAACLAAWTDTGPEGA